MKRFILALWVLPILCFSNEISRFNELDELLNKQITDFRNEPTEDVFQKIKPMAEEMISLNESDPRGYLYLIQIYNTSAGSVLEMQEALQKGISVIDRYQKLGDKLVDVFSELRSNFIDRIADAKKQEKLDRDTECMLYNMNPPPVIAEVRSLRKQFLLNQLDETCLDKAMELLEQELGKDRTNYRIYLELFYIYQYKQDYATAFAMWQVACHFGDKGDVVLINASSNLYEKALNYEINNSISGGEPGNSPIDYFLWLNRDKIASTLPPDVREILDKTFLDAKKHRAELIKKQNQNMEPMLKTPVE